MSYMILASSFHIILVYAEYYTRIGSHSYLWCHKLCSCLLKSDPGRAWEFSPSISGCDNRLAVSKLCTSINCSKKQNTRSTLSYLLFHIYLYTINTVKHPLVCKYDAQLPLQKLSLWNVGSLSRNLRPTFEWPVAGQQLLYSGRKKRDFSLTTLFQYNRVNANFKNKFDVIQISRRSTRTQRRGWQRRVSFSSDWIELNV